MAEKNISDIATKEKTAVKTEPEIRNGNEKNGSAKVEETKNEETPAHEERASSEEHQENPPAEAKKKPNRLPIFIVGAVLIIAAISGLIYWLYARQYESTDDAFIEGDVVQVNPKVSAYISKIYVKENQQVKKGDLLVELDPRDFESKLQQAQAQLNAAKAQRQSAQANLNLTKQTTQAGISQASSNVQTARNNVTQTKISAESKQDAIDQARSQVKTAEANYSQARAQIPAADASVSQARSQVPAAEANLELAQKDYNRYLKLYQNGDVPKQRFDQAAAALRVAQAQLQTSQKQVEAAIAQSTAIRQQAEAARSRIGEAKTGVATAEDNYRQSLAQVSVIASQVSESQGRLQDANAAPERVAVTESQVGNAEATIAQAETAIKQAELDLSYTKIYAPEDGIVTRKTIQEGQLVQPGQSLMALSQSDVWVVANFKESQLADMKVGQAVDIKVDAYPGKVIHAKIDSFQAGTGSRFSVLPPENATGNYVKVVQRVPVKIVFDDTPDNVHLLVPGMSVQPSIKVR